MEEESMRQQMHKALDYRIDELKKKKLNFDEGMGTLASDTCVKDGMLKITLYVPIDMNMEQFSRWMKNQGIKK